MRPRRRWPSDGPCRVSLLGVAGRMLLIVFIGTVAAGRPRETTGRARSASPAVRRPGLQPATPSGSRAGPAGRRATRPTPAVAGRTPSRRPGGPSARRRPGHRHADASATAHRRRCGRGIAVAPPRSGRGQLRLAGEEEERQIRNIGLDRAAEADQPGAGQASRIATGRRSRRSRSPAAR